MPNRNATILLKSSNTSGSTPTLANLTLGELAVNSADAKVYTLFTGGATGATSVRQVGWDKLSLSGGTLTGSLSATTYYGSGSNLTGINSTILTGGTFTNNNLVLTNSTGGTVTTNINNFSGLTVNGPLSAITISATTYYGNGSNLTGIGSGSSLITGGTFVNNNLVLTNSTGGTVTTNINNFSGLTVNGSLSATTITATTISATTFYGSGANLTGIGSNLTVTTLTSNTTLTTAVNQILLADTTTGVFTITLPTAVGNSGLAYTIKKINLGNDLTIATTLSQTIDDGLNAILKVQYASIDIVSNGANWFIV